MSKLEKLIYKLSTRNPNFTYQDLRSLLGGFGYQEDQMGKTSGSRVAFIHPGDKHVIRLHKPHPGNQLKRYQMDQVILALREKGEEI
jgi:hypothetical protein